ncbi:MAG: iron chelate uptake ABC transporter family permease subunit [Planctomycetaceae bacterium]|nr:iron chelate uptake ABC transporter family permease subunit [Planctomycetaceae bacterium]
MSHLGSARLPWVAALCALLALALGILAAPPMVSPMRMWEALRSSDVDDPLRLSLEHVRLPRALLAATIGAGLSAGGLVMQMLSGNPLATPSVLGVSNGAALGLVAAVAWIDGASDAAVTGASFLGAAITSSAIALLAFASGSAVRGESLVVAGSILGAFCGSIVTAVVFFNSMQNEMLGWTLGRLVHVDWAQVTFALPAVSVGIVLAAACVGRLDTMRLGDTTARVLGVPVAAVRATAIAAIVLVTGGSVAAAGPVAYVGLIVPHVLRRARLRPGQRLVACAGLGAVLTSMADLLSRHVTGPRVVPLGIWTMSIGALFFFALALRGHGRFDE